MFVFLPLGWFQPVPALPVWYAIHLALVPIVCVLMWKQFFPRGGPIELIACVALVGMCNGTFTTFAFAQTNFAALLAVLLFWRRRNAMAGGAWISVAFFVKPLLGLVAADPLLGRRWRVLAGLLVCTLALLAASAVAFGPGTFAAYFTRDPVGVKPNWIYSQPTNQSLLGLVLRLTGDACSGLSCVTHPIFLAGALVLGVVTFGLAIGLERIREPEWAISLLLLLAMIVYPVSQLFYSILLIPPALLAWRERERVVGGAWTVSIVVGTVFALAAVEGGETTVLGTLLLWGTMALVAAGIVRGGGWPLRPAAAVIDAGDR
jgi:hypothetical protein